MKLRRTKKNCDIFWATLYMIYGCMQYTCHYKLQGARGKDLWIMTVSSEPGVEERRNDEW